MANIRANAAGLLIGAALGLGAAEPAPQVWDTFADTWVATDALGRSLPTSREAGLPRPGKFVGMFYFLWHGEHGQQGPFDISRILAAQPDALNDPNAPWGPKHAMHHWGEPLFGYYLSNDEAVIRKHAQMLADAGVDVVIFDVTNGWTYPKSCQALMRAFAEVRSNGGRTPQIAFLCPFRNPPPESVRSQVVQRLWEDVYKPGLHPELWFRWQGKPLLLANPDNLRGDREGVMTHTVPVALEIGHSLGQSFRCGRPVLVAGGCFPTYGTTNAAVTLALRRGGPGGECLSSRRFERIADNAWLELTFDPPLPAGTYYLEASEAQGKVGWWGNAKNTYTNGEAFADGKPVAGDREFMATLPNDAMAEIRAFFTFRDPEPSYFTGPSRPDQWSWLEVYPQHVFRSARGEKEMMAVGVAQNAVGRRLGAMSEPGAMGRSYHGGASDRSPGAVDRGLNFAEQWGRALQEDPQFVFVTGWNEWIASRFTEFCGVKGPAVFPDECDQERSRDIEPMKGGHGDAYYYQLASAVRRFKGARPLPPVVSRTIQIDGRFDDWREVEPEFRDDIGDPVRRDHPGWGKAGRYANKTGRNDIVAAKVSFDGSNVCFYVRTREPISPRSDPNRMLLFIDADRNPTNGWLGYDAVVNRTAGGPEDALLERHQVGGYSWGAPARIACRESGCELELAVPWEALGLAGAESIDFKWADNIQQTGEWSDFTLNGDAAPNDRFNYRALNALTGRKNERDDMKTTKENYFGYEGCLALENGVGVRVVLSPLAGGRVLEYSLNGTNALYLNPAQQGWRHVPGIPSVDPCGGRLDVGPEKTITPHPDLWLGDWTGEIVGEGKARLTSARDRMTGLRLVREFALAGDSSALTVEQRVINESDKPVACCHWSRTLAAGGGIVLIPLTPGSRFPKNYLMYTPEQAMLFQPVDPNIRVRDGFLEVLGAPKFPKLGMDSAAGWFSYLTRNNLLFTKKYPVYPDRVYCEMAGLTISIWYFKDEMCELEPIGPRETLAPGASASFTETWSLAPMRYPAAGEAVDLAAVAKLAGR